MENLKNKVAAITGGNSGIGYATAKELKAQGATVIITGRRRDAVEKAAAELGVTGIVADQSNISDTEKLVSQVKEQFGKIDILFINAGIVGTAPIAEATEALFDSIIGINFKGAYFTLSKFIPLLNDGASVVFLSSNTASMNGASSSILFFGQSGTKFRDAHRRTGAGTQGYPRECGKPGPDRNGDPEKDWVG
jgi:NAD(P)-dependent dehydrogenase (short-subunit alcohol dehydrogenase family)